MDLHDPILARRALCFLRTASATLGRRVIQVYAIRFVDAVVLQELTFRADKTVLFGYVGELLDAVKTPAPTCRGDSDFFAFL